MSVKNTTCKNSSKKRKSKSDNKNSQLISELNFDITKTEFYDYKKEEKFIDLVSLQRTRIKNTKKEIELEQKEPLWYTTQSEAICKLHEELFINNKKIGLVVAEPGVGKTNLIHALYYHLKCMLPDDKIILGDRITIATGMSSQDWINQTADGTKLRDTRTIGGTNSGKIREDIYHNPTIERRFLHLVKNPELLSNHVFIFDECHIACEKSNTIDKYFNDIGLTKEILKKFNIKIILISATPDIVQAELMIKLEQDWNFVKLDAGATYRGFKYFKENNMIKDFSEFKKDNNLEENIKKYSSPKYHIIRVRGKIGSLFKKELLKIIKKNNYELIEHNQRDRIKNFKKFILQKPDVHTFITIKDFFRASYRIRLSNNFGLIVEPSSNIRDVSVTAQGLIARFFGYYDDLNFDNENDKPLFICDMKCVNTYIKFTETFSYNGTEYSSRRLKKNGIIKSKYSSAFNQFTTDDVDKIEAQKTIAKTGPFSKSEATDFMKKYFNTNLPTSFKVCDSDFDKGYLVSTRLNTYYNKKKEDLNSDDRLTLEKYQSIGVNTNISSKTGQSYMVYPVYDNMDSPPEALRFYIHYLKSAIKNIENQ